MATRPKEPSPPVPPSGSVDKPASPQPIDQLKSNVEAWDPHLRFTVAISAKIAVLLLHTGRYPPAQDIEVTEEEDETMADVEVEQKRAKALSDQSLADAMGWLVTVCGHLDIDLQALPDDPIAKHIPVEEVKNPFDVAFELVLISLGLAHPTSSDKPPPLNYTATARALLVRTCGYLEIPLSVVESAEKTVAQTLYFQLQTTEKKAGKGGTNWDAEAKAARESQNAGTNKALKWAGAGAGFILGGVAIGLTGGLAAPALAPLLAGTLGMTFFSTAGGAVLIGTLLGLGGGGLAGYRTHRRLKGLDDLSFEAIYDPDLPQIPSLTATIVASGFLLDLADSVEPWKSTFIPSGLDAFAMKADPVTFLEAGQGLEKWVRNKALTTGGTEVLKHTALASLYAGVALPLTIFTGMATALDSDFSRCRDKARKAGILLADILEKKIQGNRPVTLIGYGPGATMIFEALQVLHERELGTLVDTAILISLPSSPSAVKWASARSVVSHRLVNVYSKNDWLLAINARLYTLSAHVAGMQPVTATGIVNVDVSDLVTGHLELRNVLKEILKRTANGLHYE
ncbi:DUF726 domain protein [Pseudohyphozyma bogoriensis]|nr:DUF726 domain protein [Pseudohyphozyma bogoriensis]